MMRPSLQTMCLRMKVRSLRRPGTSIGLLQVLKESSLVRNHERQSLAQCCDHPGVQQLAARHRREECRRHPLRLVLADAEGAHHVRHRNINQRGAHHHGRSTAETDDGNQPPVVGPVLFEQLLDGFGA